jgi:carboxyl-terminal processing protease
LRTAPLTHRAPPFLLFLWVFLVASARADDTLERKAIDAEKNGQWLKAYRYYDELSRKDRTNAASYRVRCQYNLRRAHQALRQADPVYRAALAKLNMNQALELFDQTTIILAGHPERARSGLEMLFEEGRKELLMALDDPAFRRHHLPDARPAAIETFKGHLAFWAAPPLPTVIEARAEIKKVISAAARAGIPMKPATSAAFVLEFVAGACNGLDEYSLFLTPGHLAFVQAMLKGKISSTGIEVGLRDDRVVIVAIHPRSPAAEADLVRGDRLLRVNGVAVTDPDTAAQVMRGAAGSSVEVEVERPDGGKVVIKLVRRPTHLPSVEYAREWLEDGSLILRLRINYFTETTLQEVKDALAATSMGDPFKGILLDLRGNPGGLFEAAVAVSELFLSGGTIVISRSPHKKYDRPFKVEHPGPVQVPMVVLIDAESASAAEVLAGALKETRARAVTRLIGQPTFGKGSIQCPFAFDKPPMEPAPVIRLTVAKLFSPSDQPYTGKGVSPDVTSLLECEMLLDEARKLLMDLITPTRGSMSEALAELVG